jgi:hypothetical protein
VLFKLVPSGTVAMNADRVLDDEEENGALSTKLLLGLLDSERRDKRWSIEAAMNLISGVVERQDERLERMEQIVDGGWQKQAELIRAIESMHSGAQERAMKVEWQKWKQSKMDWGFDTLKGLAEVMLPAALAKLPTRNVNSAASPTGDVPNDAAAAAANGDAAAEAASEIEVNTLREFFRTTAEGGRLSEEQAYAAFGKFGQDGNLVEPGVLTVDQFMILAHVADRKLPSIADRKAEGVTLQ